MSSEQHRQQNGPLITALLDGELDRREEQSLRQHLENCLDCRDLLEQSRQVRMDIRARRQEIPVPDTVWPRLKASLQQTPQAAERRPALVRRKPAWAVASLLVVLLLSASWAVWRQAARPLHVDQVLNMVPPARSSSSLITQNLQEAVEWGEKQLGRPLVPVPLTMQGYTLTGASVVEVDGAPAVAFAYAADQARVWLFQIDSNNRPIAESMAASPAGTPMRTAAGGGKTLMAWYEDGGIYAMVGAIPEASLRKLTLEAVHICGSGGP